eukprot:CAMPEP_0197623326 /NCGR_PEP_ID=MMETSP1338-20131121/3370_1 /TAXON_ID=43686 ORGANISM="Pelagodinium beii, Strain RCC1491" /NCGR_SAMPLE_ID=MMETSP1338 /ASSEMBLY_ACC=CAM_ASM_000754 /LENGTH=75 /DNA_ID=CAMNT_0043193263 /DNA_START=29 /DNA_END=253 /DNA_ORIENTATION=+
MPQETRAYTLRANANRNQVGISVPASQYSNPHRSSKDSKTGSSISKQPLRSTPQMQLWPQCPSSMDATSSCNQSH